MPNQTKRTCISCKKTLYIDSPLCERCLRDGSVRAEHGIYLPGDFHNLKALSLKERQLLFLWACGQDISDYFPTKLSHPYVSTEYVNTQEPSNIEYMPIVNGITNKYKVRTPGSKDKRIRT